MKEMESVTEQLNLLQLLQTSWLCFSLVCLRCRMMELHSSRVVRCDPSITTGGAPSTRDNPAPLPASDSSALVGEDNHMSFNILAASNPSHLFCCSSIFCSTTLMSRVFLLFSSARAFLRSCTSSSNRNARSSSDGKVRMPT